MIESTSGVPVWAYTPEVADDGTFGYGEVVLETERGIIAAFTPDQARQLADELESVADVADQHRVEQ